MQLFVHAQELHTLEVTSQETVTQIKAHVASLEGIALEDQVVLLAGSLLEDEATLRQCGVEALTTLEVAGLMLGGKVHGSLAGTGKVRGQTLKVTKQEKKKNKTGQAKRRMQYHCHFVNVISTPGYHLNRWLTIRFPGPERPEVQTHRPAAADHLTACCCLVPPKE